MKKEGGEGGFRQNESLLFSVSMYPSYSKATRQIDFS